jgi:hypothetical protein
MVKTKAAESPITTEKINPALLPFAVPISSLKLDTKNARTHSDRNIEVVAESLDQFGQQIPLVYDSKRIVLKGNATLQAAETLKWKYIAATPFDHTDPKLLTGFKITDNKSAELAAWSYETLAEDIKKTIDGLDWGRLGWEQYELDPLLQAEWQPPEVDPDELEPGERLSPILVTKDQKEVFLQAIEKVRKESGKPDIKEGHGLELICLDFLSR